MKILVVEDESIVAQDLQMILEDLGYNVPMFVDSGEKAIEKALEIKPNLILMDIRLIGEMDGITAAQKIIETLDIPIIYLTAHGDEKTLERAKTTQPFGYIIKPFTEQELRIAAEIALHKHQIDRKLKENAQWLATILNSISDGVIVTNNNGNVTFLNPSAEKMTGWVLSDAVNQSINSVFNVIDENTKNSLDSVLMNVIKSGKLCKLPEQTSLINKHGIQIPISDSISPIGNTTHINTVKDFMGESSGTVFVFRDDTERRLINQQLRHQAFYDGLTNLANRVWFTERLSDAIQRFQRNREYLFAVLFLDLDSFKIVNDTLGHWTGDQLLIGVANRLLKLVRPMDTVARFGGDEFAILLENISNIEEVCHIAQRIQRDISTFFMIRENRVFTNISIGIVLSSMIYDSVEKVMEDADIAMYQAKSKGKGCYEIFTRSETIRG
ncbi:hypothetical protein GM3709_3405 [Geminocystis sp. NIES-3709]|nr:hypothetical protein GM3709_3405 [Geminocystis sp. NIES-3709]